MDKSPFVEVWEFGGEVSSTLLGQRKIRLRHVCWKKWFHFTCAAPPPRQHSSVPREIFLADNLSHSGKWEHTWFPQLCMLLILFQPIQNTKVCCETGGREELKGQQPWLFEEVKGTQILLVFWCTPSES